MRRYMYPLWLSLFLIWAKYTHPNSITIPCEGIKTMCTIKNYVLLENLNYIWSYLPSLRVLQEVSYLPPSICYATWQRLKYILKLLYKFYTCKYITSNVECLYYKLNWTGPLVRNDPFLPKKHPRSAINSEYVIVSK